MKNADGIQQVYLVRCQYMYATTNKFLVDDQLVNEVIHYYRVCDAHGQIEPHEFIFNQQTSRTFAHHNNLTQLTPSEYIDLFGKSPV